MILERATAEEMRKLSKKLGLAPTLTRRKAKRSKYGNKITYVDGKKFHSKREAARYVELKLRQDAGEIDELKCQVRYALYAWDHAQVQQRCCTYVADFEYVERGQRITEDVKGCVTASFSLKAKIFKANYGTEIRIIK